MTSRLRIATRKSQLALWQAEFIRRELQRLHPELQVDLVAMSTAGDRWLNAPLHEVGGKGLFIKELEAALLQGQADVAVHSMKDVPADLPGEFLLPAIGYRDDVRDAWVSPHGSLADARPGTRVGSSSLRRRAQLLALRPDLEVLPIRGNVDTRLKKLDDGEFDAVVLAVAGLQRLGLEDRISDHLDVTVSLPAAGQGALGIECRAIDSRVVDLVVPLNDLDVHRCVTAERAVSAGLGADCSMPLGAYAEVNDGGLSLRAVLGSPDGTTLLRAEAAGADGLALSQSVVESLRAQGAERLLSELAV